MTPFPTSRRSRAARQEPLSLGDIKLRCCALGELCWLATVSRPDICARLARIASRVNSPRGSDLYRINDVAKTVKVWQEAAIWKFLSAAHMRQHAKGDVGGQMRKRGGNIYGGTMALAGWSDAAFCEQSAIGKCRLGYVSGLMSSALRAPCRIFHRAAEFSRKSEAISLWGGRICIL